MKIVNAEKVVTEECEEIKIGVETYKVRYTMYSNIRMFQEHNFNILKDFEDPNPHSLTVMLWGALIQDRPDLDFDMFSKSIGIAEITKHESVILKAFQIGVNPEGSEKKNREEKRKEKKKSKK